MQILILLSSLTLLLFPLLTTAGKPAPHSPKVRLETVEILTVRKALKTAYRRVPAIPQLRCVGGNARKFYELDVLQCRNEGFSWDGPGSGNVEWSCKADLPVEFKLGATDIICEGYSNPTDEYVLKGSCGVEYRLLLTEEGEKKYGRGHGKDFRKPPGSSFPSLPMNDDGNLSLVGIAFWGFFISVVVWMIYSAFFRESRRTLGASAGRGTGGGGGGGGWGGFGGGGPGGDDAPPPYDWGSKPRDPGAAQQAWRPGFWSGALGGAAATYLASQRGSDRRNSRRSEEMYRDDAGVGSSGWGRSPSGSASSSTSYGSARHESTGFGSTSRR
ncbi:hypothetical protein MMC25_001189 [Agyrium rufum]|nr:hypothetical protein [Agyrium rufum]